MAQVKAERGPTPAPYFSLARTEWVAYVLSRDEKSGEFRSAEGPRGFDTYREAAEASRFLGRAARKSLANSVT